MKMPKNQLDERQEQELLKIEHYGCWFAFWGLFAALVIQCLMGAQPAQMAGEWIVFMILALGLAIGSARHGIWDRYMKPTIKNHILCSLVAAVVVAVIIGIMVWRNIEGEPSMLTLVFATAGFTGFFTGMLVYITLTISAYSVKKRQKKLEEQDCEDYADED